MQEMDRRVGMLRLLLADIGDRERQAGDALRQLRGQRARIVDFTVQFNGGVANALTALREVEEQITLQDMMVQHLALLRQRARSELDALLVTRGVADAHARLAELEQRRDELAAAPSAEAAPHAERAAIEAEIAELRASINSASEAAARALTQAAADRQAQR
jgi:NADH dehydrogenase/NADH:ubiquinone oxidoreductase subunit G